MRHRLAALCAGVAASAALAACGATGSTVHGKDPARATTLQARQSPIERALATMRHVYGNEINGARVHSDLRFVGADAIFLEDLARREYRSAQARAHELMVKNPIRHITRIAVYVHGRQLVNATWNANGSFVAAPQTEQLRRAGRSLGTLALCVQDIVGDIKLAKAFTGAYALVRGSSGQMRTSLPAAAGVPLPTHGTVSIAGVTYAVGALHLRAWGGEAITFWLLLPG